MIGTIVDFAGSWSSGIATLILQKEDGTMDFVHCDNAPTVRALASAFGEEVIGEAHTVNVKFLRGKKIDYSVDSIGILEGFDVVEE